MQTKTQTQHHANRDERTMQTKAHTQHHANTDPDAATHKQEHKLSHHANTDPDAATNKQEHKLSQATEITSTRVLVSFILETSTHILFLILKVFTLYNFGKKEPTRDAPTGEEMLRDEPLTNRSVACNLCAVGLQIHFLHPRDLRARALRLLGGRRQRGHGSISRSTL